MEICSPGGTDHPSHLGRSWELAKHCHMSLSPCSRWDPRAQSGGRSLPRAHSSQRLRVRPLGPHAVLAVMRPRMCQPTHMCTRPCCPPRGCVSTRRAAKLKYSPRPPPGCRGCSGPGLGTERRLPGLPGCLPLHLRAAACLLLCASASPSSLLAPFAGTHQPVSASRSPLRKASQSPHPRDSVAPYVKQVNARGSAENPPVVSTARGTSRTGHPSPRGSVGPGPACPPLQLVLGCSPWLTTSKLRRPLQPQGHTKPFPPPAFVHVVPCLGPPPLWRLALLAIQIARLTLCHLLGDSFLTTHPL